MLIPLAPQVSNVIAITKLKDYNKEKLPSYLQQSENVKTFTNYISVKLASLTLVLFPSTGHVNITGIVSFEQLFSAAALINHVFGYHDLKQTDLTVVSSTCSGYIVNSNSNSNQGYSFRPTSWRRLSLQFQGKYTFTFKRGLFPSVIIRNISPAPKWTGCIQLFTSGSYNIVGCKSQKAIEEAVETLKLFLTTYLLP